MKTQVCFVNFILFCVQNNYTGKQWLKFTSESHNSLNTF